MGDEPQVKVNNVTGYMPSDSYKVSVSLYPSFSFVFSFVLHIFVNFSHMTGDVIRCNHTFERYKYRQNCALKTILIQF